MTGNLRGKTLIGDEMNKPLKRLIVHLIYKSDWRKLFISLAILTVFGIVLQISLLSFPLSTWLHSPLVRVSSAKNFSSSIQLRLSHEKYWPLHQISAPVPLNSSSGLIKGVHRVERKRRRRRKHEDELQILVPPPTPKTPPTSLQVFSVSSINMKFVNWYIAIFINLIGGKCNINISDFATFFCFVRDMSGPYHLMRHSGMLKRNWRMHQ